MLALAIMVAGGFAPVMAAVFWKNASKAGAITSSIAGAVSVVVLYGLKLSHLLPAWIDPILVSVSISVILMFGVSKLTFNPKTATQRLLDLQD